MARLTPILARPMPIAPPERPRTAAYYHSPEVKYAKHARKRCLCCGQMLQGKYWLLDSSTWACMRDGDRALSADVAVETLRWPA